jgi:UDP-glucose 4-epimerase
MTDKKVVLVTGVAGFWGRQVANRLIARAGSIPQEALPSGFNAHIIGVDNEPPEPEIDGLDFIQADIRNPLLVELLRTEAVDIVCHLAFVESTRPTENSFDMNVMGAMKVLGASAEAGVGKVVLKSSTSVYGAKPTNPAFLTEDHALNGSRVYGTTRDLVEIEAFCNGFRHQVPEMVQTVLRFPNIVGPDIDSPMTRFLKQPWTPTLLGFDPLMQVIHEQDVIAAIVYAVVQDAPGVYNVAAEGVLPLARLTALAGKFPIPVFHLVAYLGAGVLAGSGLQLTRYVPIELDYIRYSWVADLTRMREELGFVPRYTAEEVLREFAGHQRLSQYMPESAALAYDEERLRDTLERRRRARARQEAQVRSDDGDHHDE